jgi:hypothetical protein
MSTTTEDLYVHTYTEIANMVRKLASLVEELPVEASIGVIASGSNIASQLKHQESTQSVVTTLFTVACELGVSVMETHSEELAFHGLSAAYAASVLLDNQD